MRKKNRRLKNNSLRTNNLFKNRKMLLLLTFLLILTPFFVQKYFFQPYKKVYSAKITHSITIVPKTQAKIIAKPPILIKKVEKITPTATVSAGFCINVPVLLYHHIQPAKAAVEKKQQALSVDNGIFDQQMSYLVSHNYNFIFVNQLVDALYSHSALPAKSIAITLDDGYKDWYDYAYPIFKKYNIKANLMVAAGLMGGSDFVTWDQLEEMNRSGLFYFVDHTWSHYAISHGTNEKIKYEIETARDLIKQHTGQKVDVFAYPYGGFNNNAISILQQEGFRGAFSTLGGSYQCDSYILTLHRTRIGNANLSSYGL